MPVRTSQIKIIPFISMTEWRVSILDSAMEFYTKMVLPRGK